MDEAQRSGCPINPTLEVVGDKWSLLIIRDMMFGNRRHFRELLTKSEEGISSNILADRLKTLLDQGIITWADDPSHKQKGIYSLTEQGIELLPILAQMSGWGFKYLPVSEELGIRAKLLDRKSTRLNSSHANISYAVFCLKTKKSRNDSAASPSNPAAPARSRNIPIASAGFS